MHEQTETLETADGTPIAITRFHPQQPMLGKVIIACAMGVSQQYYGHFARWLASQGYCAVTFDYRGIGLSAPSSLKGFQADIRTWAEWDCAAVLDHVAATEPDKPLFWVGHSLGGQIIGMVPNCHLITKAITVASGNGYWKITVKLQKILSLWMWYVVVPLAGLFCSYFPGRKLRKIGDLPMGVIKQWRRWCLSKRYLMDNVEESVQQRYRNVRFPITFYALADDEMLSYQSIKSVHGFYQNAPRQLHLLQPEAHGVKRIGHLGFFRRSMADKLWKQLIGSELSKAG